MATLLGIGFLAGGPVVGALCAIALGATGAWQVIMGAVLGQGVAIALGRAWSEFAAARTMQRALDATRARSGGAPVAAGGAAARPTNVVIRAAGLTWRDHLAMLAGFAGFAGLLGALIALGWRAVAAGR
jgi:hypothetical protein